MGLIHIEGPADRMREILRVPGVDVVVTSVEHLGDGRMRVAAYVADQAVPELRARGGTVTVIMDDAQLQAHLNRLRHPEVG